ncbi:MAG: lipoprotein [Nitrosospira multiformis]|nr:lipoprotein [Nitrosospira multiformis]
MKRTLILLIAAVALSGCATKGGYEKKLIRYNGLSERDLIILLGTPQQVYEEGGKKFLTYSRIVTVPAEQGSIGNTRSCETTFEVEKGIVIGSTWKGNACKG